MRQAARRVALLLTLSGAFEVSGQTITLSPDPLNLTTNASALMTITLSEPAPIGGLIVNIQVSPGSSAFASPSVSFSDLQTMATFQIDAGSSPGTETVSASASGFAGDSAQVVVSQPPQTPLGTAFTYQGRLATSGAAANGGHDFEFRLFDALTLGNEWPVMVSLPSVSVSGGLFSVQLDFGPGAFAGQRRWLEIRVQPAGGGGYTALTPRQELTAVPNAVYAVTAATINGLSCSDGEVPRWNSGTWACGSAGTVTSVGAGDGLLGGPITSSGTLSVNLGGSGLATAVSRADHDHFGQAWTGAGDGLTVNTTSGFQALSGRATATAGSAIGVSGRSDSTEGDGVYGYASATTGSGHGVFGLAAAPGARGVYGLNNASAGSGAYGVYGQSMSTNGGTGVLGVSFETAGTNYGIRGEVQSTSGRGVAGFSFATSGVNFGVRGQTNSTAGTGVYGFAFTATGTNYGVYGRSDADSGRGVYGEATNTSGATYGVYGNVQSSTGRAVYGRATSTFGSNYGVYGETMSTDGWAGYFQGRVTVNGPFQVPIGAASGRVLTSDATGNATWQPAVGGGTVTSVGTGDGLTGGPVTSSGTIAVAFGGSGSATAVARSDHAHAGMGTVTSVTAGTGLTGGTITTSGTIGVSFGGTGVGSTVARSDHTHAGVGTANTFVGASAGNTILTGSSNTATGNLALSSVASGNANTAFGARALDATTSGSLNSAFGADSLASSTGSSNSAFGADALLSNTTGAGNAAFGESALQANTAGQFSSAFGYRALLVNTAGGNSAFGASALQANSTGARNAAFGFNALSLNATSSDSSAFGYQALLNSTAGSNSAFGANTLASNTTGCCNAAFGANALDADSTGSSNSAFGFGALGANTSGVDNAAFGARALDANTTGWDNAAVGADALGVLTAGDNNVAIGSGALSAMTSGNNNIAIGFNAGSLLATGDHNITIGQPAGFTGGSGRITIGSSTYHTSTQIAGIFGTVVSPAGSQVYVNSNGLLGTFNSSRNYKHTIADMGGESEVLMRLRPVSFYYRPELDKAQARQYGLVAEEVAEIAPELVLFDKQGRPQTVSYHLVNAMLLNETQKQQRRIRELEDRLAHLEALVGSR